MRLPASARSSRRIAGAQRLKGLGERGGGRSALLGERLQRRETRRIGAVLAKRLQCVGVGRAETQGIADALRQDDAHGRLGGVVGTLRHALREIHDLVFDGLTGLGGGLLGRLDLSLETGKTLRQLGDGRLFLRRCGRRGGGLERLLGCVLYGGEALLGG